MRRALIWSGLLLCACPVIPPPASTDLNSFQVDIKGWYLGTGATRVPLPVVTVCSTRYGGQAAVPAAERGAKTCPFAIARGDVEVDVVATALTGAGKPKADFASPVSFRVVPGDLTGDYANRWAMAQAGVATGTVRVAHQFAEVRVWAENAPPALIYSDGGVGGTVSALPVEPQKYTYASGLSPAVFFEDPTIAKIQIPDGFDNRSSPFVGEFLTIGKNPESGETLVQSCSDDIGRDQKPALMVVTGTDPSGFFVTDVSACRQVELTVDSTGTTQVRTTEPKEACTPVGSTRKCAISGKTCAADTDCNSYLPGTYGSMFIYNYSFPDGLDEGDLLFTISGAAQEFTSTTQLTFPSWTIAEKVRLLPEDQWTKWSKLAPPVPVVGRICGGDNTADAFLTDELCGHNKRNLKMESLESALVSLKNVRFPETFAQCDVNGDSSVPFFCEQKDPQLGWLWGSCAFGEVEPAIDAQERQCHQDCVFGTGPYLNQRCAEKSTFVGFGQFPVEMGPYGLDSVGMDESLPLRFQSVPLAGVAARTVTGYLTGQEMAVGCEADAHVAFGDGTVSASATDAVLPKGKILYHRISGTDGFVSVLASGTAPANARCSVSLNSRTLINVVVKDAIPELQPDCSESDPDAAKARSCQALHQASFDVTGHLRHVQPARPRWVILPRDLRDVCCHPGPLGECPKPIQPCP